MELPENLIAAPATNQLDYVSVDARTEEVHGTSGAEGLGGYILGFKYQVWPVEIYGGLEGLQGHGEGYVFPPTHQSHDAV